MDVPCDDCSNTGEVQEVDVDGYFPRTVLVTCYTCGGSGYLEPGTPKYEEAIERFFAECIDLKHQILRQMGQKAN